MPIKPIVLFFPVSTNTVRVLWGLTVLPIAITVPVLFACITVIPESPGHGTKVCMQMYNTRWISSQCVCRSSQESHTSLKNEQKGRDFPQPLGTLCPLKQSPQLSVPTFTQQNLLIGPWLQWTETAEVTLPTQCCCFSITGVGTSTAAELNFWVGFGRQGWELRCKLECKLASHLLSKTKGKMPIGTATQKKSLDGLAEDA